MVIRKIIYARQFLYLKNIRYIGHGGNKPFGVAKYLTPICCKLNTWLYRNGVFQEYPGTISKVLGPLVGCSCLRGNFFVQWYLWPQSRCTYCLL